MRDIVKNEDIRTKTQRCYRGNSYQKVEMDRKTVDDASKIIMETWIKRNRGGETAGRNRIKQTGDKQIWKNME